MEEDELEPNQHQDPDEAHIDRNNNDLRFDAAQLQVADNGHVESSGNAPAAGPSTTADPSTVRANRSASSEQSTAPEPSTASEQSAAPEQSVVNGKAVVIEVAHRPSSIPGPAKGSARDGPAEEALDEGRGQGSGCAAARADKASARPAGPGEAVECSRRPEDQGAGSNTERVQSTNSPERHGEAQPGERTAQDAAEGVPEVAFNVSMFARRRLLAEDNDGAEQVSDDEGDRLVMKRSVPVQPGEAALRARVHGHITSMLMGGWARVSSKQLRIHRLR